MEDLFFISIGEPNDRDLYRYYNLSIPVFTRQRKCIQFRQYSPEELGNDTFQKILVKGHSNPVFILFNGYDQTKFVLPALKKLYHNTPNMTIFTHDLMASVSWYYFNHYPETFPDVIDISDFSRIRLLSIASYDLTGKKKV